MSKIESYLEDLHNINKMSKKQKIQKIIIYKIYVKLKKTSQSCMKRLMLINVKL